jgi:imidazolonepropionase
VILEAPSYPHLVYHYGINPVRHVIKGGQIVVSDARLIG